MSYESERRAWPRKACLIPAILTTSKKGKTIDGYVTDISADGLRLRAGKKFVGTTAITVGFSLLGENVEVSGSIQWRDEDTVGIRFDRPVQTATERDIFAFVNSP